MTQRTGQKFFASFLQKRSAFLLLLSAIFILLRTRDFYFFSDDFLNFIIASDTGLTWPYLTRDVFGQFIPLYRLTNLIYLDSFGLQFWPFRALLVLSSGASLLLIARIGAKRRVSAAIMLPLLTMLIVSPVFIGTFQWWSAALSVTTSTIACLTAISLSLHRGPLGAARRCGIAFAFMVGLGFYPKTLFVIILLCASRLFVITDDPDAAPNVVSAMLRDLWPTALLIPFYIAIVHFGDYNNHAARPDLGLLLLFIWHGWNEGFLANVFGLHNHPTLLVITNVAALAAFVASLVHRPRTAILLLGFTLYFITSIGVIGWNRAAAFGLETAELGRYYADVFCYDVAFFVIAVGTPGCADSRSTWTRDTAAAFATIGLAIYLAAMGLRVPHLWYAGPATPARFVANLKSTINKIGVDDHVADNAVPREIMPDWMAPLNGYRFFLPLLGWHGHTVPLAQATVIITNDGTLRNLRPYPRH